MAIIEYPHNVMLGLTGNPPTWAHIDYAKILAAIPTVETIFVTPVGEHPDKPELPEFAHRLAMTQLGIAELEPALKAKIVVTDIEARMPGVNYTVETLRALSSESGLPTAIAIGGDQALNMEAWGGWDEILEVYGAYAISRVTHPLDGRNLPFGMHRLGGELKPVCSHMAREAVLTQNWNQLFRVSPLGVVEYLQHNPEIYPPEVK